MSLSLGAHVCRPPLVLEAKYRYLRESEQVQARIELRSALRTVQLSKLLFRTMTLLYVPVLKWKRGEQSAVKLLDKDDKKRIFPLAEVPDRPYDYEGTWHRDA